MSPRDQAPRPAGDVSRRREESTPALARDFSSGEGGRAPGRATCVRCGHPEAMHALARDNRTRTTCSVHEGPKATPCGCRHYVPQPPSEENPHA